MNAIRNLFLITCMLFSARDYSSGLSTLFVNPGSEEIELNDNLIQRLKLAHQDFDLKNMRIGLIINHSSRLPFNNQTLQYLLRNKEDLRRNLSNPSRRSRIEATTNNLFKSFGFNVVRIFSPEHGISGKNEAGEYVPSTSEVISLYGESRAPKDEHLEDLDVLIFDIQDIGVRYYTYASTMTLAMEKAAEKNIKFIVLDRPNPLNGIQIEGSVLDLDFKSFVGMHPIPVRYGMTIGELALFIKKNNLIKSADKLDLRVIPGNWSRSYYSDGGRCKPSYSPTSANLFHLENVLLYVGTCLLEGTNVSEGRGSSKAAADEVPSPGGAFAQFGAPWLDSEKLIQALKKYNFKGVSFASESFTPTKSKFKGIKCNGVRISVNREFDEDIFNLSWLTYGYVEPFRIGVAIIEEIYKLHPNDFEFKDKFFDKLYGSSDLRLAILESKSIDDLMKKNEKDIEEFKKLRERVLLYD